MKNKKTEYILLLIIAFILGHIPIIQLPFSWLMTFFHEISHGLAAIASGGKALKIVLFFNGEGLCYTAGGNLILLYISGYLGAVLWGTLMYCGASIINDKYCRILTYFFILCLISCILLLVNDVQTLSIILIIAGMYGAALKLRQNFYIKIFLKLSGLYVVLDALKAPTYLFSHTDANDAQALYEITGIAPFFWVLFWIIAAFSALVFMWRMESIIQGKKVIQRRPE